MQRVTLIELNNIGLHKSTTFDPKQGKCVAISGVNKDSLLSDANGSGKSTLLEPLFVCFVGTSSRGCSLKELINRDEKHGWCSVDLVDSAGNNTKIRVDIYTNKSTKVSIWENDSFRGDLHDLKSTESFKYIQDEILDISKKDLLDFFLISSESKSTFLSSTASQKQSVISRFSESDVVDDWIEVVKVKIKDLKSKKDSIERNITSNRAKFDSYNDRKESLVAKLLDIESKPQPSSTTEQIYYDKNSNILSDIDTKLVLLERKKSDAEVDIPSIDEQIHSLRSKEAELTANCNKGKNLVHQSESALKTHHTCPKCSHKFDNSNKTVDVDKETKFIKEAKAKIEGILLKIKGINDATSKLSSERRKITSNASTIASEITKLKASKREYTKLVNDSNVRLSNIKNSATINAKLVDSINVDIQDNQTLINNCKKAYTELSKQLSDVNSDIVRHEFWKVEYGNFKHFLNQNTIKLIECKINDILKKISDYELKISDRNSNDRSEITITIDGSKYSTYSGGEKGRIDVSSFVAFRSLINDKSSKGLDFLSIDEAIDKVDKLGLFNITSNLNELGITSVVISHVKSVNEDSITVQRENNIARLL